MPLLVWFLPFFHFQNSVSEAVVTTCDSVCEGVNLSQKVILLVSEPKHGTSSIYFNSNGKTLATLYWVRDGARFTVGLAPHASEIYEHESLTLPTKGNLYQCSFTIVDNHLRVYLDGSPVAVWDMDNLEELESSEKQTLITNTDVDFTQISGGSSDTVVQLAGARCLTDDYIDETGACQACGPAHWGSGSSSVCASLDLVTKICGGYILPACPGHCNGEVTRGIYGEYTWNTTRKEQTLFLTCDNTQHGTDPGLALASRVCGADGSWGETDESACLTEETKSLENVVENQNEMLEGDVRSALLTNLAEPSTIGTRDVLLTYDVVNGLTERGRGQVTYEAGMDIISAFSSVAKAAVCENNPSCFWLVELLRSIVPRLQEKTRLLLSEGVGMFALRDQSAVLDLYTFCQNNFHDMITGCANDDLSFLRVMENELYRIIGGTKTHNITLAIIFSDGGTFYPTNRLMTAKKFNETVYDEGANPEGATTIASMIVDITLTGIPESTTTELFFKLNSETAYARPQRIFTRHNSTYELEYVCAYYSTNQTLDSYLAGLGSSWNPSSSLISSNSYQLEPSKLLDGSNVGTWNTDDCETHYDHFTDNPRIWCACEHSSRAFTVLARVNRKEFPDHYVGILISVTVIILLGLLMGAIIIFIPNKWMGIPKTAKLNVGVIMILLLVALYFFTTKMIYEFSNFQF